MAVVLRRQKPTSRRRDKAEFQVTVSPHFLFFSFKDKGSETPIRIRKTYVYELSGFGLDWVFLERKDMVMNVFESRKRSLQKLIYTAAVK